MTSVADSLVSIVRETCHQIGVVCGTCRSVREDLYLATDGQVTYYSADVNLFIAREESPLLFIFEYFNSPKSGYT